MSEENPDSKPIKLKLTRRRIENLEKEAGSTDPASSPTDSISNDEPSHKGLKLKNPNESEQLSTDSLSDSESLSDFDSLPPIDIDETPFLEEEPSKARPNATLQSGGLSFIQETPLDGPDIDEEVHSPFSEPEQAYENQTESEGYQNMAPVTEEESPPKKLSLKSPGSDSETASASTANADNATPESAEEFPSFVQVEPIAPRKKKGPENNLFVSIAIIAVLLGILGGSAYGIWYVLAQPSSSPEAQSSVDGSKESAEQPSEKIETDNGMGSPAGAIDQAKEVIATIPSDAMNEIIDIPDQQVPTAPKVGGSAEKENADPLHKTVNLSELKKQLEEEAKMEADERAKAELKAAASGAAKRQAEERIARATESEVVKAVSAFLGDIHIDGMRRGANPKVMIGGTSYLVGDVIESESGLTFQGFREGKLAFKDKNGVVYLKSF